MEQSDGRGVEEWYCRRRRGAAYAVAVAAVATASDAAYAAAYAAFLAARGAAVAVDPPHRRERGDPEKAHEEPPGPGRVEHQDAQPSPLELVCTQRRHEDEDGEAVEEEVARVAYLGSGGEGEREIREEVDETFFSLTSSSSSP